MGTSGLQLTVSCDDDFSDTVTDILFEAAGKVREALGLDPGAEVTFRDDDGWVEHF